MVGYGVNLIETGEMKRAGGAFEGCTVPGAAAWRTACMKTCMPSGLSSPSPLKCDAIPSLPTGSSVFEVLRGRSLHYRSTNLGDGNSPYFMGILH